MTLGKKSMMVMTLIMEDRYIVIFIFFHCIVCFQACLICSVGVALLAYSSNAIRCKQQTIDQREREKKKT
jgi:hypothetical protein